MKVEKAPCYDNCPIEHQCCGGYIENQPECEIGINEIQRKLETQYPESKVAVNPTRNDGVIFTIKLPSSEIHIINLLDGMTQDPSSNT